MYRLTNNEEKKKEEYFRIAQQDNTNTSHLITSAHAQRRQIKYKGNDFTTLKQLNLERIDYSHKSIIVPLV
jgi:hypothetical protein